MEIVHEVGDGDFTVQRSFRLDYKDMDNLLKCPICFEHLKVALMISHCSHTFCSLCIRKYLSYKNICPVCNTPTYESDLKNNRLVDDIVEKFKSVGLCYKDTGEMVSQTKTHSQDLQETQQAEPGLPAILDKQSRFTRIKKKSDSTSCRNKTDKLILDDFSPNTMRTRSIAALDMIVTVSTDEEDFEDCLVDSKLVNLQRNDKHKRRAIIRKNGVEDINTVQQMVDRHKPRSSGVHLTCNVDVHTPPGQDNSLVDNKEIESREVHARDSRNTDAPESCVLTAISLDSTASLSNEEDSSILDQAADYNAKMPCPVCSVDVSDQVINRHLDRCLASAEKKSALRRLTPRRKPMAKLVYNIMSERDIRKKLREAGLSSKGDKQALIKRHHDFTLMYNAECDALNPRPVEDLIKELEDIETARLAGTTRNMNKEKVNINKNSSPVTIQNALQSYENTHKSQFDSLLKEAKKNCTDKGRKCRGARTNLLQPEDQGDRGSDPDGVDTVGKPDSQVTENISSDKTCSSINSSSGQGTGNRTTPDSDLCVEMSTSYLSLRSVTVEIDRMSEADIHQVVAAGNNNISDTPEKVFSGKHGGTRSSKLSLSGKKRKKIENCDESLKDATSDSNEQRLVSEEVVSKIQSIACSDSFVTHSPIGSNPTHDQATVSNTVGDLIYVTSTPCVPKRPRVGLSPFKTPLQEDSVPMSPGKRALFVDDSEYGSDKEDGLLHRVNNSIDSFCDDGASGCSHEWPALSQAPKSPVFRARVPVHLDIDALPDSPRSRRMSGVSVHSNVSGASDTSSILPGPQVTMEKIQMSPRRRSQRGKAGNEPEETKQIGKRKRSVKPAKGRSAKRRKRTQ